MSTRGPVAGGLDGAHGVDADVPDAAVHLTDVEVRYGERCVLERVTLTVPRGRIVGLVGPNGAGKTTLFKALVGLVAPDRGTIRVFGAPPRTRGRRTTVAYVPQHGEVESAFPVTVMDVVLMGRYGHVGWLRRPRAQDRDAARAALARVGLADLADRPLRALSGGQRQRAFLARALAQDASLYLMDEPFTGVDARTQEVMLDVCRELRAAGRTLVVATHDLATVPAFCDDVVLLDRRVVAHGPAGTVFTKENLARTFGGRLVLLGDADGEVGFAAALVDGRARGTGVGADA